MFNALEKVGIATVGTAAMFTIADKAGMLPGFFQPTTMDKTGDVAQQRRNSFMAGIITGGIVTAAVLAIWKR